MQAMAPKYRRVDWKYVLERPFRHELAFDLPTWWQGTLYAIHGDRTVSVDPGYAWDGPSGPTFDTGNSMRAALIHDVLYQAIREGGLPASYRRKADREFRRILKADGMTLLRRLAWWLAVRLFGSTAT